eukprot:2236441-Pleurochrysis_carterae.AAC.1
MASQPSGQASELFTPLTIPIGKFSCTAGQAWDEWGGGRRRRRARRPAPGSRGYHRVCGRHQYGALLRPWRYERTARQR